MSKTYAPNETGLWRIRGEDPNCDFGGSHHQPELAVVTGTYCNVEKYAKSLKGWMQWGSGGTIEKLSATLDVDKFYSPKVQELEKRKLELEKDLAETRKLLEETLIPS